MKRRTTPILQISHPLDMSLVATVDFLFKHSPQEQARTVLIKSYPGEVTETDGVFSIPFSKEETALFSGGCRAYCDPRVVYLTGQIPNTAMMDFSVEDTLWGEQND